jgi:hypothetical protein
MQNLSSLLERFKNFKNPKDERIRLAEVVSRCLGFGVLHDSINLQKDILYLKVEGYLKTEIYIKKEMILESIKKEGFTKIIDIR